MFRVFSYKSGANNGDVSDSAIKNTVMNFYSAAASFSQEVNATAVTGEGAFTDGTTTAEAFKATFNNLEINKTYSAPTVEWKIFDGVGTYRKSRSYSDTSISDNNDKSYGLVITHTDADNYPSDPLTVSATFESASVTDTSTD